MKVLVALLAFVAVSVPLGFAWRILRLDELTRTAWLLVVLDSMAVVALILVIGRWDIVGYYTRAALVALLLVAVAVSWMRHAGRAWRAPEGVTSPWRSKWSTVASLLVCTGVLAYIGLGTMPQGPAREFQLPLKDGRFMVGHGGGNRLINYHAVDRAQRHAVDFTAINDLGFRASGILPENLDDYVIYGSPVVSPCEGRVLSSRDGLPDLVPPRMDPENPAGNHVVIRCGDLIVELAHLQKGSVRALAGQELIAGEPIGKVGNSGNTSEPHLHVHAVDAGTGAGVPMHFEGSLPVRNRLYVD